VSLGKLHVPLSIFTIPTISKPFIPLLHHTSQSIPITLLLYISICTSSSQDAPMHALKFSDPSEEAHIPPPSLPLPIISLSYTSVHISPLIVSVIITGVSFASKMRQDESDRIPKSKKVSLMHSSVRHGMVPKNSFCGFNSNWDVGKVIMSLLLILGLLLEFKVSGEKYTGFGTE
jgi:hypothetical protein